MQSEIALALPRRSAAGLFEVDLRTGSSAEFENAIRDIELKRRADWYHYARLEDRSWYVRWNALGEFLVSSDGRRIVFARGVDTPMESFQVYLLGQALSFALVKGGLEPFHATAIVVDGEALAILGGSGFGKSSLAACFLAAGESVLTDDLLLLAPNGGGLEAYPGPPRIKLFPRVARRFLGRAAAGIPMNPYTGKLVIPLGGHHAWSRPLRLRAVYALAPPHEARSTRQIKITPLSRKESFMTMVGNTFNHLVVDAERLNRQVTEATRIVDRLQVKKLCYPRGLGRLCAVREAILSDFESSRHVAVG